MQKQYEIKKIITIDKIAEKKIDNDEESYDSLDKKSDVSNLSNDYD